MVAEITQIHIFDTLIEKLIEKYDPDINNIKVYGNLDNDGFCSNPLFLLTDVYNYLYPPSGMHFNQFKKHFSNGKEKVKCERNEHQNDRCGKMIYTNQECILLTKYGLIAALDTIVNKKTKSAICFREFIYSTTDSIIIDHTQVTSKL